MWFDIVSGNSKGRCSVVFFKPQNFGTTEKSSTALKLKFYCIVNESADLLPSQ